MDDPSLAAMYGRGQSPTTPARHPERKRSHVEEDFLETLHNKSAHFESPPEPANSPPTNEQHSTTEGEEKLVPDHCPLKLHRNRFAVGGRNAGRKPRFDLNKSGQEQEECEVKSR